MKPYPKRMQGRILSVLKSVPVTSNRGAVAVEYALCMLVAASLMVGVQNLFTVLAREMVQRVVAIVLAFPDL